MNNEIKYFKCVIAKSLNFINNKIYKTNNQGYVIGDNYTATENRGDNILSYHTQFESSKGEEYILQECKIKYPIGTRIKNRYNVEYVIGRLDNIKITSTNRIGIKGSCTLADIDNYKWVFADIISINSKIVIIKGQYYREPRGNIVKAENITENYTNGPHIGDNMNSYKRSNGSFINSTLILASEEDKKWLNKCIESDNFISKEEALEEDFVLSKKQYREEYVSNIIDNTLFSLEDIKNRLKKYYDTEDVKDIIESIEKG